MSVIVNPSNVEVKKIPIELLKPSRLNSYLTDDFAELQKNIEAVGLLTPLTVCPPNTDGIYEIISGERRYLCLQAINSTDEDRPYAEVPCLITEPNLDDLHKELAIEISNLEQREMKDGELNAHRLKVVKLLSQLMQNSPRKDIVQRIADSFKCNTRYASMFVRIFGNKNQEIQNLVAEGKIPVHVGARACTLNPEDQEYFVDLIRSKLDCSGEKKVKAIEILEYVINKKRQQENKEETGAIRSDIATGTYIDSGEPSYQPTGDILHSQDKNAASKKAPTRVIETHKFSDSEIFDMNNGSLDEYSSPVTENNFGYDIEYNPEDYMPSYDGDSDDFVSDYDNNISNLPNRSSMSLDTSGRFATVDRSSVPAYGDDEQKTYANVRRTLERIKSRTEFLDEDEIDLVNYIGDWYEFMKNYIY